MWSWRSIQIFIPFFWTPHKKQPGPVRSTIYLCKSQPLLVILPLLKLFASEAFRQGNSFSPCHIHKQAMLYCKMLFSLKIYIFLVLLTPLNSKRKKLFNEKNPGFSSTKGPEMWLHKKCHKVDWLSKQNQRKKLKGSLRKAQPLLPRKYNGCDSMKCHYTHAQNFFLEVAKAVEQPAYENALVHMFLMFL